MTAPAHPFLSCRLDVLVAISMGHDVVWLETRPHVLGFRNTAPRLTQGIGNTALYSIYREHSVILNLSGTRRHIAYMRYSASYPWYRQHGAMTHQTVPSLFLLTPTCGSLTVAGNKLKTDLLMEEFSATE
jgi:hypothetical protein